MQVLHYMERESEPQTHSHPSWSLLTNEAKAGMVGREDFDPYIKDKSRTCAHCSVHYLAQAIRKGGLTIVKLRTSPLVASVALLSYLCPYARTYVSFCFTLLYKGTKSASQSKTSTTSTSSRRNELRARPRCHALTVPKEEVMPYLSLYPEAPWFRLGKEGCSPEK